MQFHFGGSSCVYLGGKVFVLNLIEDIHVRLAASLEKWLLCEGTIQLLTTSTYAYSIQFLWQFLHMLRRQSNICALILTGDIGNYRKKILALIK